MEKDLQTVPATMPLEELADRIGANDPSVSRRQASLVVDEEQCLVGIITRGDVVQAIDNCPRGTTVLDACTRQLIVAHPDEPLQEALIKMLQHDIGRLPVVERTGPRRPVGYLGRAHLLAARSQRLHEESVREPGWLERARSRAVEPASSGRR